MTPQQAYRKARKAGAHRHGKRMPELERIILNDPFESFRYAMSMVKARWIEAEDIIMTDPRETCRYAERIIKGKLPPKMHNRMLLYAMQRPNDKYVKNYFELINTSRTNK